MTGTQGKNKYVQYDEISTITNNTIDKEYGKYVYAHTSMKRKMTHLAFFEKHMSDDSDPCQFDVSLNSDNVHPKYLKSNYDKMKGFDIDRVKIKIPKMLKAYSDREQSTSNLKSNRVSEDQKVRKIIPRAIIVITLTKIIQDFKRNNNKTVQNHSELFTTNLKFLQHRFNFVLWQCLF